MIYIIITSVKANDAGENQNTNSSIRRAVEYIASGAADRAKYEVAHDTTQSFSDKKRRLSEPPLLNFDQSCMRALRLNKSTNARAWFQSLPLLASASGVNSRSPGTLM
jgi:hypothetical protein